MKKQEATNAITSVSHLENLMEQTKNTEPTLSKNLKKLRSALSSELSKMDEPDMDTVLSYDDVEQISNKTIDSVNKVLSNENSFEDKKNTIRQYETEMSEKDKTLHPEPKKMTTEEFLIFMAAIIFLCTAFKDNKGGLFGDNYGKKNQSSGIMSTLMAIPEQIKEMAESAGKSIKHNVKNFFNPSPFKKSNLTLFSHNIAKSLMKIEELQEQKINPCSPANKFIPC